LRRLAAAGLSWPLPAEMTATALEAQLFTALGSKQGHRQHAARHRSAGLRSMVCRCDRTKVRLISPDAAA